MIVIDTHVWLWWVDGSPRLTPDYQRVLQEHEATGIGVSAISCWEVAKLVEYKRLELSCTIIEWLDTALGYPGVQLLPLTPQVAAESTQLPGNFHRDPADQIIVATARVLGCSLLTVDEKIRDYLHVQLLP